MAQAVLTGMNLLDERKKEDRPNGIQYYRPWVPPGTAPLGLCV
jgi:uncharacterized protein YegL